MNTGAPWPVLIEAESRVLVMQTKLHQWATSDPGRRFDDLYNLVCDPAFLVVALDRVKGNKGARSAGVDGVAPRSITDTGAFLDGLRDDLKARRFTPTSVRERMIPKANGKLRRLGIPTAADRVVQASLKLVLEPIFEADFKPCSYGFRPRRRAQDAIAEIHYLGAPSRKYDWVFEADIKACFDEIDHTALMGRVRDRIGDKRVLGLVKAFLRAGVLSEDGVNRGTITGTPQGGILSPLLANIALSVLDEHFTRKWEALGPYWTRPKRRRAGEPAMKLVRYADDFVVMIAGDRDDAQALWEETATVLAPVGLRLSEEKTRICHIDDGFDFLGWRIQRRRWRGRTGQASGLHLPVEEELALGDGQGAVTHSQSKASNARGPAAPVEPGAAGLVQLLPSRRVVADLQLRRPLRLLADRRLAPQTTRRAGHAHPGPPLPPRMEDSRRRDRDVPTLPGQHRALPLPGRSHPDTMDERTDNRTGRTSGMTTWRAGCGGSRTSGSEGGPEKPTHREVGRALRSDPYTKLQGTERGVHYELFVIIDIFSRYVVGWMVFPAESGELADAFIADTLATQGVDRDQLTLHADRGTSMTSKPVVQLLVDLGVARSHSRPHVSNYNPYSEANFKTFKYSPAFPGRSAPSKTPERSAPPSSSTTTTFTAMPAPRCGTSPSTAATTRPTEPARTIRRYIAWRNRHAADQELCALVKGKRFA